MVRWRIIVSSKIVDTMLSASLKDIVTLGNKLEVTYPESVAFLQGGVDA